MKLDTHEKMQEQNRRDITRWKWLRGRIMWELTWFWRNPPLGHPQSWIAWSRSVRRINQAIYEVRKDPENTGDVG